MSNSCNFKSLSLLLSNFMNVATACILQLCCGTVVFQNNYYIPCGI